MRRLAKNAPGAWYTTGACLACGLPEATAPMVFAPLGDENWQTWFVRQPATAAEAELACRAAVGCCVADVRYGGRNRAIIRRLGNHPLYCDNVVADDGCLVAHLGANGELRAELATELWRRGGRNCYRAFVDGRAVTWWWPRIEFDPLV